MRKPIFSHRFNKDYKLCQKRGLSMPKLHAVMFELESGNTLSSILKEHPLLGEYKGCLECHIEPDWLLIYQIDHAANELYFVRTGTHADLFD